MIPKSLVMTFMVAIILFLTACSGKSSRNNQVHNLIGNYVAANFDDPGSYEPLTTSTLDSVIQVSILPEVLNILDSLEFLGRNFRSISTSKLKSEIVFLLEYDEKDMVKRMLMRRLGKRLEYFVNTDSVFIDKFSGWEIWHTYRTNNEYGAKVLRGHRIMFDAEITKITQWDECNTDVHPYTY